MTIFNDLVSSALNEKLLCQIGQPHQQGWIESTFVTFLPLGDYPFEIASIEKVVDSCLDRYPDFSWKWASDNHIEIRSPIERARQMYLDFLKDGSDPLFISDLDATAAFLLRFKKEMTADKVKKVVRGHFDEADIVFQKLTSHPYYKITLTRIPEDLDLLNIFETQFEQYISEQTSFWISYKFDYQLSIGQVIKYEMGASYFGRLNFKDLKKFSIPEKNGHSFFLDLGVEKVYAGMIKWSPLGSDLQRDLMRHFLGIRFKCKNIFDSDKDFVMDLCLDNYKFGSPEAIKKALTPILSLHLGERIKLNVIGFSKESCRIALIASKQYYPLKQFLPKAVYENLNEKVLSWGETLSQAGVL